MSDIRKPDTTVRRCWVCLQVWSALPTGPWWMCSWCLRDAVRNGHHNLVGLVAEDGISDLETLLKREARQ